MGKTTDEIEADIDNTRQDLKSNLQELETRVKAATDWRGYFRKHSGSMLAVAFGGGVLLSSMVGKRARSEPMGAAAATAAATGLSPAKHEALKGWDTITSALVGAATTKFKGVLSDVVPGFAEHLEKVDDARSDKSVH